MDSATSDVPFINIMMIGETGAGKSSFFNTVATALEDSSIIKDTYRVGSAESREMSVTKKVLYLKRSFFQVSILDNLYSVNSTSSFSFYLLIYYFTQHKLNWFNYLRLIYLSTESSKVLFCVERFSRKKWTFFSIVLHTS